MRPSTTQCWRPELPLMGCCCSNSKIRPAIVNRREEQNRLKRSTYAPPSLAVTNANSKPVKVFSFGETGVERKRSQERQQSLSSEEEIVDNSEHFRKYNKELVTKQKMKRGQSAKTKVPKTKGFDFPLFPGVHGQNTPQIAKSSLHQKSSVCQTKKSPTNVSARSNHSSASRRTKDQVSYKRMSSSSSSGLTSDDYTAVSSDDQHNQNMFLSNQRKLLVQRRVIEIERKDASTQYYEQIYSSRLQLHPTAFTQHSDSFEDVHRIRRHRRTMHRKNDTNSRPVSRRRYKAAEQRVIDAYLAQPKVLIVPIVRESRKSRPPTANTKSNPLRARRILRKPWLVPSRSSQRHVPMLRESGVGSSNIRFSTGVKIRSFDAASSESTAQDTSSQKRMTGQYNTDNNNEYQKSVRHNPYTQRPPSGKTTRRPRTAIRNRIHEEQENVRSASRQRRPSSRSPTTRND